MRPELRETVAVIDSKSMNKARQKAQETGKPGKQVSMIFI